MYNTATDFVFVPSATRQHSCASMLTSLSLGSSCFFFYSAQQNSASDNTSLALSGELLTVVADIKES